MFDSINLDTADQPQLHSVLVSKFAHAYALMDDGDVAETVKKAEGFADDDGCVTLANIGKAFLALPTSAPCFGDVSKRKVKPEKDFSAIVSDETTLHLFCAELFYCRDTSKAGEFATFLSTYINEGRCKKFHGKELQIVSDVLSDYVNECGHRTSLAVAQSALSGSNDARNLLLALLELGGQSQILEAYESEPDKIILAMRTLYSLGLAVHQSALDMSDQTMNKGEFSFSAYRVTPFGQVMFSILSIGGGGMTSNSPK